MGSVLHFGRRRGGLPRYAGFVLLALLLGGVALHNAWRGGQAVPAPSPALLTVRAVDGDTLNTQSQTNGHQRIRLAGIDAPELSQTCRDAQGRAWSCGAAARNRLAALVAQGDISCAPQGTDRYGRTLATCSAGAAGDIGAALVRDGYAVNYSRYTSDYAAAESEARAAHRGIWQGDFERPEDWRRAHAR